MRPERSEGVDVPLEGVVRMPRQALSPFSISGLRADSCTWLCSGASLSRVKAEGNSFWGLLLIVSVEMQRHLILPEQNSSLFLYSSILGK